MGLLKVNGVAIPSPQTLEYALYDLDAEEGAGRNQMGEMFRDRVAVKRKLVCTWGPKVPEEMSTLLKAVDDVFFTLEYPDAHDGTYRTGTFYVGDRTAPVYMWNDEKQKFLWTGLSMNFIER